MPREDYTHKMVNGERVELTEAEIDECMAREEAHNAQVAAEAAAKPMNDWLEAMAESDKSMTRVEEDILEALDDATKQRVNQEVHDKLAAKKALRADKP